MTKILEKSRHVVFVVKDVESFLSHRLDLSKFLLNRGFRVSLVTDFRGATNFPFKENLTSIVDIPLSEARQAPWRLVRPMYSFFRFLSTNRNITVFSITLLPVLISGLFCKILGIRQFILFAGLGNTFHGEPSFLRSVLKFLIRLVTKKSRTEIIAHNHEIQRFLVENGYAQKVSVVAGSGINSDSFSNSVKAKSNIPPKILFFGRLLREKGVVEFIEASKLVIRAGYKAEFILAGRTDKLNPTSLTESELKKWLLGEKQIHWIGSSNSVKQVLASVDIVCLPSYHEGLPRSLLEGALMGCCLVATDISGVNDIVISGKTGILVNPKASQDLAEGFIYLLENPGKILELAENAKTHVLNKFTNDTILPKYFELIAYP